MKKQNYYIGLDMGTDSVGYAAADEQYELCRFKGEPMWGTVLFEGANSAAERRSFRTDRRRLDRRQQRVKLIRELFAKEISKTDDGFFKRIEESRRYPESEEEKVRLFDTYENQKAYAEKYPTIHHLLSELMESTEAHDVRLVYIACAWLAAHRGHFLSEVDKKNIAGVTDFKTVYDNLAEFITRDNEYSLPWNTNADLNEVRNALKASGVKNKAKLLTSALFGSEKVPNAVNDETEYNYQLVLNLICGGDAELKKLFGKEEYGDLNEKKANLGMPDEIIAEIMSELEEREAELISVLKSVYDWSVLTNILNGRETISQAKVEIYERHGRDLKLLKYFVKKYAPEKYCAIFRQLEKEENQKNDEFKKGYSAYVGKIKADAKDAKKSVGKEDFCRYIKSVFKSVKPDAGDKEAFDDMMMRLDSNTFMPKQVESDNRVIPYQLYWHELNKIIENAKNYLPFLSEADEDGITAADKILSVFEFKIPYYVGPLKENRQDDSKFNHWLVRKAEGRIYPWNFEEKVDLDASENAFIRKMTNSCTYLPGEDVLPKNSLLYSAFEVLNEINCIKVGGTEITPEQKQGIYSSVFMKYGKVTPKRICEYLKVDTDQISGIDKTVKSSLKSFLDFKNLMNSGKLGTSDVEKIIERAAYSEDKPRLARWIKKEYPQLDECDVKYISNLKLKEFGRLSKKLLCGIEGAVSGETGEPMTIIRTMWETNCNFMQVMSDKFDFGKKTDEYAEEYYGGKKKSISERLEEMRIPNLEKRPIIRSLEIVKEIAKVRECDPKRIFIEMARGSEADREKGKNAKKRYNQIIELYKKVKDEDVPHLLEELEGLGEDKHNKLQKNDLFLYFIQLGRCMYTGEKIEINSIISKTGEWNREHIYPRSEVKDDSILNNIVLVKSEVNGAKNADFPIKPEIRRNMRGYWEYLHKNKLITDEKFKRLTRNTPLTDDEKFEFINRQLVETRQSTKAAAKLLKELYPNTEIVYVKAGNVSDFRNEFEVLKSRAVNDLHHAKDAYLNIVVGNVYHCKFSRQFWKQSQNNNPKPEFVFNHPVVCGGETVWNGARHKERVCEIARKNTAHLKKHSYCQKGGFFDQNPVSKGEGLVPLKKGLPTEIYGGYKKTTASFFVFVKYTAGKKQDIMLMPVELLYADKFKADADGFAVEYAKKTVSAIVGKDVDNLEFLFKGRIVKINTVLSLDGLRVCITGKSSGGKKIAVSCLTPFKTSPENEDYIKRLESFENKKKKNENIFFSEKYHEITAEQNIALYDCFIEKMKNPPYRYRPANPCETLEKGREKFIALTAEEQIPVLLAILGLFGRAKSADLTAVGGAGQTGVAALSSLLSNWKKSYTDVRIIDQSASGIFEKISDVNLLDLL